MSKNKLPAWIEDEKKKHINNGSNNTTNSEFLFHFNSYLTIFIITGYVYYNSIININNTFFHITSSVFVEFNGKS